MAKLLVVDDEKNIRANLVTFFEGAGHQVKTAENGSQALALLSIDPGIDLMLTDYRMAEMNGLELLQQARREVPNLAVILMTAYATVENAVNAMKRQNSPTAPNSAASRNKTKTEAAASRPTTRPF